MPPKKSSVADPDPACHFDADPDPACHFDAHPDPTFHCYADPDPQHWKKSWKFKCSDWQFRTDIKQVKKLGTLQYYFSIIVDV